jgi:chromosome partitioning protein
MKTIAVTNHKGGVGKTTTAQALGVALAAMGHDVVLVDMDPQASLTRACGVRQPPLTMAHVLGGLGGKALVMSRVLVHLAEGLRLAPASLDMAQTELWLVTQMGRELALRTALASIRADLALVDCPPSLGLLTVNALVAADAVLVPTQTQELDLSGLGLFLSTLDNVRRLNPALKLLGILPTFYDPRLRHHQAGMEAMKAAGLPLLPASIGRSVRVAEAATAGQSIVTYEPGNPQAKAYVTLAEDVDRWLKAL